MIAEGALVAERFERIDVALDDEVGVGGHFELAGLAFDEVDGFAPQVTGHEEFVEAVGQRGGGAEGVDGVAPKDDGDGHARAGLVVAPAMARPDLLQLPVHAGGVVVVDLDAVHADVAFARVRVARDDAWQGDKAAAVERPAFQDGKIGQSGTMVGRGS